MKHGSVLILALWALVFLGALAVAVGVRAAACIRLAEHLKISAALDSQASAGVERAVAVILAGDAEKMSGAGSKYWSMDNGSIEGGTFSVLSVSAQSGVVVTNYGVVCESARTNINNMGQVASLVEAIADKSTTTRMVENIRQYRLAKKLLTQETVKGKFQSIYELLLVDGMTYELFETMAPYITIFDQNCYSGISVGRIAGETSAGQVIHEREISFVFDAKMNKMLYWSR